MALDGISAEIGNGSVFGKVTESAANLLSRVKIGSEWKIVVGKNRLVTGKSHQILTSWNEFIAGERKKESGQISQTDSEVLADEIGYYLRVARKTTGALSVTESKNLLAQGQSGRQEMFAEGNQKPNEILGIFSTLSSVVASLGEGKTDSITVEVKTSSGQTTKTTSSGAMFTPVRRAFAMFNNFALARGELQKLVDFSPEQTAAAVANGVNPRVLRRVMDDIGSASSPLSSDGVLTRCTTYADRVYNNPTLDAERRPQK